MPHTHKPINHWTKTTIWLSNFHTMLHCLPAFSFMVNPYSSVKWKCKGNENASWFFRLVYICTRKKFENAQNNILKTTEKNIHILKIFSNCARYICKATLNKIGVSILMNDEFGNLEEVATQDVRSMNKPVISQNVWK